MSNRESIHDLARGRWRAILTSSGVHEDYLTGKHGPCPMCGGKDRFRWTDHKAGGGYICNQCGAGSGVDLIMAVNKLDFPAARRLILERLDICPVEVPVRESAAGLAERIWAASKPLTGMDAAAKYLRKRGLKLNPAEVRVGRASERVGSGWRQWPALIARFAAPDRKSYTVQTTYLDSAGNKAPVPEPRKLARAKMPEGGAVRLAPSAETMGIAEGVETALAAAQIHGVPVWAALNAGLLTKWQPPDNVRHILIFGDNDRNCTGQAAAYALAHRLHREGRQVEVRIPDEPDTDWNDCLMGERAQ